MSRFGPGHGFSAEFDANKPLKRVGRVTEMDWINPHAWIHMDVKGDDGKVVSWMVELGPPNALLERGWNKNSLPEGTEIIVDGHQSKDGELRLDGRDLTSPMGRSDSRDRPAPAHPTNVPRSEVGRSPDRPWRI